MKKSLLYVLLALPGLLFAQSPISAVQAELFQAELDKALLDYDLHGVSVHMTFPGDKYWSGVAGMENDASQTPMDTTFSFWSASCTKLFTAATIFKLVEQDSISLDDKVVDFIPSDIPNVNANATIKHALQHTSGIGEFLRHPQAAPQWYNGNANKTWDPAEVLRNYLGTQDFHPGSGQWAYSNTNFVLLGMVVERVTGQSFATYLRTEILNPLALEGTWFPPFETSENKIATGYSDLNQNGMPDDATFLHSNSFASMVFTAGGLVSSPKDLAVFVKALISGELFEEEETLDSYLQFLGLSISANSTGYGHGCTRFKYYGDTYYGHGGDINGYTNYAIYSPETGIALGMMINIDQKNREAVTKRLLQVANEYLATGVESYVESSINLYPNPATDWIYLKSSSRVEELEVRDVIGKTVLKSTQTKIYVGDLEPGQYFVKTANGAVSKSFVKL